MAVSPSILCLIYKSIKKSSISTIPSFLLVWMMDGIWWDFASRIRFWMAGVECMTSKAATRPLPSAVFISCWDMTHSNTDASCTRIWSCWWGGKTSITRSTVAAAPVVCSVEKTKWPVSAAVMASLIVSRSRISPTRITSGSSLNAERSAFEKERVSWPNSRWWIILFLDLWTNSIGSSIVRICSALVELI